MIPLGYSYAITSTVLSLIAYMPNNVTLVHWCDVWYSKDWPGRVNMHLTEYKT